MSEDRSRNPYQSPAAGNPAAEVVENETIESLTGWQQLVKDVFFAAKFASLGFGVVFLAILILFVGLLFYRTWGASQPLPKDFAAFAAYTTGMLFLGWLVAVFWVCATAAVASAIMWAIRSGKGRPDEKRSEPQ